MLAPSCLERPQKIGEIVNAARGTRLASDNAMKRAFCLGLAAIVAIGCAGPDDEEPNAAAADSLSVPDFFGGRIAVARFYHSASGATAAPPRACVANIGD